MTKSERQEKALNELADVLENHWAKLPPSERAARKKAFYDRVTKDETPSKPEVQSASPENHPQVRRRA